MARIRSIKPEVRISEKVNSWPIECRYFWVLLWGYCDDYGYGRDNPRLIVADSFPLDDSITAEMVSEWMDMLWQSGVIERFAVADSRYFHVINWDEHQKISHPAKQFLPTIDEATEVFEKPSESLRRVTETFEKTSPKQGAGSREQGAVEQVVSLFETRPNLDELFESAFSHWPKRVKRDEALSRFKAAAKKLDPNELTASIVRFGDAYEQTTDKQYVPALGPWLYQKRWTDELPTAKVAATRTQDNLSVVAHYAQQQQEEITA